MFLNFNKSCLETMQKIRGFFHTIKEISERVNRQLTDFYVIELIWGYF